ncbi:MFS family permease [Bradyrhizobium sp. GM0.4]
MPLLQVLRPTLPILIGASIMLTLSMGLRQSLGIFMQPLTHDIHLSISDFTLALAVQNLAWGFLQPLAGAMTTRYGFRPIMIAGSFMYIAGLVLMATANGLVAIMIGAGVLIGTSLACTAAAIAMSVAARAVPATVRSTVLGIVSGAGSLGALLSAPIGQMLNEGFGWRIGLAGFVVMSVLMIPAAWYAGRVDAVPLPKPATDEIVDATAMIAAKTAFGNASFVVMTCAYLVCGMQLVFLTTHLPSYLAICGLDPMLSAQTLGMIGGFNVLGSLFFGWAGQRWNNAGAARRHLRPALAGAGLVLHVAGDACLDLAVRRNHGLPVDGCRTAGRGRGCRDVRPALAGDDPGPRLHEPPDRQLPRCLRRRAALRRARLVHDGLAHRRRAGAGRRHHPGRVCADPAVAAAGAGVADGVGEASSGLSELRGARHHQTEWYRCPDQCPAPRPIWDFRNWCEADLHGNARWAPLEPIADSREKLSKTNERHPPPPMRAAGVVRCKAHQSKLPELRWTVSSEAQCWYGSEDRSDSIHEGRRSIQLTLTIGKFRRVVWRYRPPRASQ